jgi:hypothetical protein
VTIFLVICLCNSHFVNLHTPSLKAETSGLSSARLYCVRTEDATVILRLFTQQKFSKRKLENILEKYLISVYIYKSVGFLSVIFTEWFNGKICTVNVLCHVFASEVQYFGDVLQFMRIKESIKSVYLAAEISHDCVSWTEHRLHVNIQVLIQCRAPQVSSELLI